MAGELLPTNYTDATWEGLKKYRQVNNPDGTVSFEDVTVYENRENSFFSAQDANTVNETLNTITPIVDTIISDVTELLDKVDTLAIMGDNVFYQCKAVYEQGAISLSGLPTVLPEVFTVRFITPSVFTTSDVLRIGDTIINLLGANNRPLADMAWGQGVIVSLNVNYNAATAFFATTDITVPEEPHVPTEIYGVSIDLADISPEGAVTYTDDAVGMIPGDASWDDTPIFKGIRPCVLKSGVVQYYLNPDNYEQKADGSPAVITGADGDVMVEIPKLGYQIVTTGDILTVRVTANPNDRDFRYYAHTREIEGDRDKLYIGAYTANIVNSQMRSISGGSTSSSDYLNWQTVAHIAGKGYDMLSFYPLTLLQCLFLIRFKNRDSQGALGAGYVAGTIALGTGSTNAKGMYFGETTGKLQMKCFGIEDLWGNRGAYIEGIYSDSNLHILTAFNNFNYTGSGYTDRGQGATGALIGKMVAPQGTSETGFVAKSVITSGSSRNFAVVAYLMSSRAFTHGGGWQSGTDTGIFSLIDDISTSNSRGARLMYL